MIGTFLFLLIVLGNSWAQQEDITLFSVTNPWARTGESLDTGVSFTAKPIGNSIQIFWCRKDAFISHSVTCPNNKLENAIISVKDFYTAIGSQNPELSSELVRAISEDKLITRLYGSSKLREFVKNITLFNDPESFFQDHLYEHYKKYEESKSLSLGLCTIQPVKKIYSHSVQDRYGHQGNSQKTISVKKELLEFEVLVNNWKRDTLRFDVLNGKADAFQKIQKRCFPRSIETPKTAISDKSKEFNKNQESSGQKKASDSLGSSNE
jgi:hypothetical protein